MPTHAFAVAVAWQLWTRHRQGIVTALVTLAVVAALAPLFPLIPRLIAASIVLVLVIGYFMNLLLFTDTVGGLDSTYPRRMYALPVPTRTLVGWPMLYGGGVVALLWALGACLIYRPSGFQTPVLVPALGLAAILVWLQACAWSPIQNMVLKLYMPLIVIALLVAVPVWKLWLPHLGLSADALPAALPDRFPEPLVLALLVLDIALAYAVARAGIASDRKGDTWRVLPGAILHAIRAAWPAPRGKEFRSPAEAQFWYEWSCHGLVISLGGAGWLLILLVGTFFDGDRQPGDFRIRFMVLVLLPLFTPAGLSPSLGSLRPFWGKSRVPITFLATRPMNSGAIVAAKLRMTSLGVVLLLATTAVGTALWVVAGGYTSEAVALWRVFLATFPGWRAAAVLVLGAVTVTGLALGMAMAGFSAVLTGRNSALMGFNFAIVAGAMSLGAAAIGWTRHPAYIPGLIAMVPWLLAAVLVLKVFIASVSFRACLRLGLIEWRSIIAPIAGSLAMAACAIALAALLSEAGVLPVPVSVVLLAIVLLVPLGQFALAPLALEWNRHR